MTSAEGAYRTAIPFARAQLGARRVSIDDNITDTYRGPILIGDDGAEVQAIIKDLPLKELANELLGAALAQRLELPCPGAYLTIAPSEVFDANHAPLSSDGERLVFASSLEPYPSVKARFTGHAPEVQIELLTSVAAWPLFGQACAFDTWIANIDRHMGNLLYAGHASVLLIDHGRILTGSEWLAADLRWDHHYQNRLVERVRPYMDVAQIERAKKEVNKFELAATTIDVEEVIHMSHIASLLDPEDVDAVRGFLRDRLCVIAHYATGDLGEQRLV